MKFLYITFFLGWGCEPHCLRKMVSCGKPPGSPAPKDLRRFSALMCGDRDLIRDGSVSKNIWERRRLRSRTAVMTMTWMLTGVAGFTTAAAYSYLSLFFSALPSFIYTVCSFIGFRMLRLKNRIGLADLDSNIFVYQEMQLILLLILPPAMHLMVGGLNTSSNVVVWSIMAPAGSIFYCQKPQALRGALDSQWVFARVLGKIQQSLQTLCPVMADTNVWIVTSAFLAVNVFLTSIDPYVIPLETPPLRLRQVSGTM